MPKYTESPRYQRAMARLRRLSPEQQAVFSSLGVDKAFAGEEMSKKIKSMGLATAKKTRQTSLQLGERRLALGRRRHEFAKSQILPSTLIGLGQVGLGVAGGMAQRKTSQELARLLLSQGRQYTRGATATPGPAPHQAPGWTGTTPGPAPYSYSGGRETTSRRTRPSWGQ